MQRHIPFLALLFVLSQVLPSHSADLAQPPLMLANVYDEAIDLSDYWVSEKLDGVRAYWNGRHLVSRNGNIFHAPAWFIENFPTLPLDGELWSGRGTFEATSAAVRRQTPVDEQWRRIRFMVFDLPTGQGSFNKRLLELRKLMAAQRSPYLALVEQQRVASRAALQDLLDQRVAQGAEGLMLHRGSSHYRALRSNDLLKLKPYQDAEAVVVAHIPGQGKYTNSLGSLLVEMPDGKRFKIGTGFSDAQRKKPPAIGATVTYKFFGWTNKGIPRFASFLRERTPE